MQLQEHLDYVQARKFWWCCLVAFYRLGIGNCDISLRCDMGPPCRVLCCTYKQTPWKFGTQCVCMQAYFVMCLALFIIMRCLYSAMLCHFKRFWYCHCKLLTKRCIYFLTCSLHIMAKLYLWSIYTEKACVDGIRLWYECVKQPWCSNSTFLQ